MQARPSQAVPWKKHCSARKAPSVSGSSAQLPLGPFSLGCLGGRSCLRVAGAAPVSAAQTPPRLQLLRVFSWNERPDQALSSTSLKRGVEARTIHRAPPANE